jgi:hypothetical protein
VQPTMRMTRILVFVLLILRLVGAPISSRRPEGREPGSKDAGFTVRVCKWPAQRLERSTVASIAVPRNPRLTRGIQTAVFCAVAARADADQILICLFDRTAATVDDLSARRRFDSPRC